MSGPDLLAIMPHVLVPHLGWILWAGVILLVLTERPRAAPTALPARTHLLYTLAPVAAGLATLLLSGLLGLILFYRSPLPLTASFLNFIPAMIGMFAMPELLMTILVPGYSRGSAGTPRPTQTRVTPALYYGVGAGVAGISVIVVGTTSWPGLLILLTATGIGLLPRLFQARPIQGIGLALIPLACALM
ncbi:MAG: hypothetical protein WCS52_16540 [bacterium]